MIYSKVSLAMYFCVLYMICLGVLYFSKERIKNEENKIYKMIIISNLFGLILHLFSEFLAINSPNEIISKIIFKVYLSYHIVWVSFMLVYLAEISAKNKQKTKRNIHIVNAFLCTVIFFLPIEMFIDVKNRIFYAHGIAAQYVFFVSSLMIIAILLVLIVKRKVITQKKAIPFYIFLTLGTVAMILQYYRPELTIVPAFESVICFLMYFTIENPDLKMIEQLNIAKSEAERANMAKSDFLASMSHEIRTPLNAITGFSHAILNDETLSSESLEYANDIVKASNTLLEIVGGVLDVSKIESNKMDIVEVLYNPREEIEDLVKIVNARLGEKPVVFNYKVAEDLPYQLYGDRANMKKVVTNLLTNAVKYTSKGQIFFNVRCINKDDICHVVISVQDTGMGIKEEHISKLFTKFERLEVEKNTTAEGTGLGLAITKKLVELMGGKINVKSQYGVGSIFMTQIPQRIAMMSKPLTDTQILSTVELKNKRLKEEANIDGQRILIVDDNALNIKVAKIALKNFNLVLDEVESGEECLEKIKSGERYDLILMDIMMPGLSGEETFIELKKIVGFNTPVIALTADAVSGSKEKYLSQGFTSYISKPFSPEEIKLELAKIFKTKR